MKYVALFRGINVGGKNIVKMANLKEMFLTIGFEDVTTYIQSGNVIFESNNKVAELSPERIVKLIENSFAEGFGFKSKIVLRSKDEIGDIINCLPFRDKQILEAVEHNQEVEHLYIYFFGEKLPDDCFEVFKDSTDCDEIYIGQKEVYLLCMDSIRNSDVAKKIEKIDGPKTCRNIKTVTKIFNMMA